jgi:Cytidylyltransferase family
MIEGHGGMLDRLDSVCFAAPVFFPPDALLLQLMACARRVLGAPGREIFAR